MASMTSSKTFESWTLAAVWLTAKGTPPRSTTTKRRFEPAFPLSVGIAPVFWPPGAGTLAEPKDALSQAISSALPSRSKKIRCSSYHTPASCHSLEPTPTGHCRATAHLLGQHLPGYAALEDEQDASEGCAVVDAWSAAVGLGWLLGQQRLDHLPQFTANVSLSHVFTLPTTRFCRARLAVKGPAQ